MKQGARVDVVDREAAARPRLGVIRVVLRADVDGVGAVRGEARCREGVRPVAACERRGLEDLAAAAERRSVPVVARALADRDLDGLDAGGRIRVRAAEAVGGAPGIPVHVLIGGARGREREERARVRRVVREAPARRRLSVRRVVRCLDADRVGAVRGEARRREGVRPAAACERRGLEDLAAAAERRSVPVVARALADGDLHLLHARRCVGVRAAEADRPAARVPARGVVHARGGGEARRRARRHGVDRPRVARGRAVGVTGAIGGPDEEGVAAFGEARVALRACARGIAAAVDLALEGRAPLSRAEGEARVRGRRRVRRIGVDRRVGGDAVDRERAARGCLGKVDVVGRADANRVGAVGREARGREDVGPVPAGKGCRVPDFAARAERAGTPVVACTLADRDLHLLDTRAARGVRVGAAVAVRRTARIPAGSVVAAAGGRERRSSRRRGGVDRPRVARCRAVRVAGGIGCAYEKRVAPVGEGPRVALRARARRSSRRRRAGIRMSSCPRST